MGLGLPIMVAWGKVRINLSFDFESCAINCAYVLLQILGGCFVVGYQGCKFLIRKSMHMAVQTLMQDSQDTFQDSTDWPLVELEHCLQDLQNRVSSGPVEKNEELFSIWYMSLMTPYPCSLRLPECAEQTEACMFQEAVRTETWTCWWDDGTAPRLTGSHQCIEVVVVLHLVQTDLWAENEVIPPGIVGLRFPTVIVLYVPPVLWSWLLVDLPLVSVDSALFFVALASVSRWYAFWSRG